MSESAGCGHRQLWECATLGGRRGFRCPLPGSGHVGVWQRLRAAAQEDSGSDSDSGSLWGSHSQGPFRLGALRSDGGKTSPPQLEGSQGTEGPGHFVWSVGVSARRCWESPGSGWGLRFKRRRGHGRTGTSLLSLQGALSQLWPGKGPQRGWGSLLGHLQLLPAAQQGEGPHQPAKWWTMLQTL